MIERDFVLPVTMDILALSGCNTMEGFGKDSKPLGSKIEKKVEEKK
jgi:predicted small secreted protein